LEEKKSMTNEIENDFKLRAQQKYKLSFIVTGSSRKTLNPFVTSGTYISHLQRVFTSPLG
jgi:hypothetical protein